MIWDCSREHLVLNELHGRLQIKEIRYWRDKQDHELDFIWLSTRNAHPTVIECKWKAANFEPNNLKNFRQHYREGRNFVVSSDIEESYCRYYGEMEVVFVGLSQLIQALS